MFSVYGVELFQYEAVISAAKELHALVFAGHLVLFCLSNVLCTLEPAGSLARSAFFTFSLLFHFDTTVSSSSAAAVHTL